MAGGQGKCTGFTSSCHPGQATTGYKIRAPQHEKPFGRRVGGRNCLHRAGSSGLAHEIALADLDAVMAQDVVRGGGMKVEIRQRKMAEELLPLQRHGLVWADRKRDLTAVGALELCGLEAADIFGGVGQPRFQLGKAGFGIGRRGASPPVRRAQPLAAKSETS
jgi:hypothetical protein